MNQIFSRSIPVDIVDTLSQCIFNHNQWQLALSQICQHCHAKKALITYRQTSDAKIVIPTRVEEQHASPVIFGFCPEKVESFLTKYAETDPWTMLEARYHPHTPYPLSKYFPLTKLHKHPFWEWLSPQKIDDSIVAQLDYDRAGWTALNLYFETSSVQSPERVIARLNELLPMVANFWQISKKIFQSGATSNGLEHIIAEVSNPCLALNEQGQKVFCNTAATELEAAGLWSFDRNYHVVWPEAWQMFMTAESANTAPMSFPPVQGWVPTFCAPNVQEFLTGEVRGLRMVVFNRLSETGDILPWENPALSTREQMLVEHLAKGGKVKDGADLFKISERANASIWSSARHKLGDIKKQDLQAMWRKINKT